MDFVDEVVSDVLVFWWEGECGEGLEGFFYWELGEVLDAEVVYFYVEDFWFEAFSVTGFAVLGGEVFGHTAFDAF